MEKEDERISIELLNRHARLGRREDEDVCMWERMYRHDDPSVKSNNRLVLTFCINSTRAWGWVRASTLD